MKIKPIEEVKSTVIEAVKDIDVEIYDVEFKQGKNPALTVFIKKQGGVDLNLCELVHKSIDEPLDKLDFTYGEPYTLNVSSIGIDWAFKSDEDFNSHIGQKVELWLKNAVKGKKYYDGILLKYDKKNVVIKVNDKLTLSVELSGVKKVNEYIDFE